MELHLTKVEREMLNHRLQVSDCIAEYLEDNGIDCARLEGVVAALLDGRWDDAEAIDGELTIEVLADCVAGGTYYVAAESDEGLTINSRKLSRIAASCHSLANKVSEAIGRHVRYPMT